MEDSLPRISKLEAQVEAIKEDVAEVKSDIKDLHSRITTGNREIMDKLDMKFDSLSKLEENTHASVNSSMEKLSKRVETLETLRWMLMGAAVVLGYLIGNMDIVKFFK
jgi:predicted  nucleic acid-binding Zn-ribbon protein